MFSRDALRKVALLVCGLVACGGVRAAAQSQVVEVKVHSAGLERNLLGDPADQPVSIYLPAAYAKEPQRRFPVLFFLHGYTDTNRVKEAAIFQRHMDEEIASGRIQPFLVVLPNGLNKYMGAFYANSASTGNWDDYITRDVVAFVDQHYRTEAAAQHRAISGHSMGGYGALTLAFRHPEVFGQVYAFSPCCTDLVADFGPSNDGWARAAGLTSPEQVPAALQHHDFFAAALTAFSAALAPDASAKTFADFPFVLEGGSLRTNGTVFSRVTANLPVNMVDSLLPNILRLKGIFVEYGAQDNFSHIPLGAQELSAKLSKAGVSHTLEVFQGDHGNHLEQRIADRMLPWVSEHIAP